MKKIIYGIMLALSICALSCKKNLKNDDKVPELNVVDSFAIPEELMPVGKYLSSTYGISISDIKYRPADSSFSMEGDMIIKRISAESDMKSLKDVQKLSSNGKSAQPSISHRKHSTVADLNTYTVLKIFNNCSNPDWKAATSQAIRNWNHPSVLALTKIRMNEVFVKAGSTTEVKETGITNGTIVAEGQLPFPLLGNRVPGTYINIYTEGNTYSVKRREVVITHELGHIIGFRHTDTNDGDHIGGTPTTNPYSIMNSGFAAAHGDKFLGFTSDDIWAMYFLHGSSIPPNTQVPGNASNLFGGDNNVMYSTGLTPQPDGNYVFRVWNGSQWVDKTGAMDGKGIKLALTTAGQYYYITADKKIYRGGVYPAPIQLPGEAIDIAANSSGELFIVSNTYQDQNGNKIMKWNGSGWDDYLPLIGAKKIALPAGPNALPFIVDNTGTVRTHTGSFWVQAGSGINAISIAACNYMNDISRLPIVYVINGSAPTGGGFEIRRWTGSDWLGLPGGGVAVAVGTDGHPWHISNSTSIYKNDKY